ncbi:MAG TPA: acyl carrier protein [Gemmatimonadales bacterium]|nr:acyl carrier protein [Gemmatimonadales bacterium]
MTAPIDDRLKAILAEVLEVRPAAIADDFSRDSTPNWDSLGHLTLVSTLESEFGVTFGMAEMLELTSYRRIRDALAKHMAA